MAKYINIIVERRNRDLKDYAEIVEAFKKNGIEYRLWYWGNSELTFMSSNMDPSKIHPDDPLHIILLKTLGDTSIPKMLFSSDGPYSGFLGNTTLGPKCKERIEKMLTSPATTTDTIAALYYYPNSYAPHGEAFSSCESHSSDGLPMIPSFALYAKGSNIFSSIVSNKWTPFIEMIKSTFAEKENLLADLDNVRSTIMGIDKPSLDKIISDANADYKGNTNSAVSVLTLTIYNFIREQRITQRVNAFKETQSPQALLLTLLNDETRSESLRSFKYLLVSRLLKTKVPTDKAAKELIGNVRGELVKLLEVASVPKPEGPKS